MVPTEKKESVASENQFLDEALALAREAVQLRERFNNLQLQHRDLVNRREEFVLEGIDVLPKVRALFLEIEEFPGRIDQLDQRVRWIIGQGVEALNVQNSRRAGLEYVRLRDMMREALEQFRKEWVRIHAELAKAGSLAGPLTQPYNARLEEIRRVLGATSLPRVSYSQLPLPTIDIEVLKSNGLLAALDRWIVTLR